MKKSTHIIFAITLLLTLGIPLGLYSPSVPEEFERPCLPRHDIRYHKMAPPEDSWYDEFCQATNLASNIIPIIVSIAWFVTWIRSRRRANV